MTSLASTDDKVDVGGKLARVRASTGLSQAEFAASLGLSLGTYANYERGARELPSAVLRLLAEVHRVDPLWVWEPPADSDDLPRLIGRRVLDLALLEDVLAALRAELGTSAEQMKPKAFAGAVRALYAISVARGRLDRVALSEIIHLARARTRG
jgi:transcriptional regulator with XRE-family HTH domain